MAPFLLPDKCDVSVKWALSLSSDGNPYSSEKELGRLCTRKNILWKDLDEQRLLASRKENNSWG